jgi:hypothetical protein
VLITVAGFTGWFERAINRIPLSLASGMLAGVLLRFGLDVFLAMRTQFTLAFGMFAAYLVARRLAPRYAVIAALAVGVAVAAGQGLLRVDETRLALAAPVWVTPRFTAGAYRGGPAALHRNHGVPERARRGGDPRLRLRGADLAADRLDRAGQPRARALQAASR